MFGKQQVDKDCLVVEKSEMMDSEDRLDADLVDHGRFFELRLVGRLPVTVTGQENAKHLCGREKISTGV